MAQMPQPHWVHDISQGCVNGVNADGRGSVSCHFFCHLKKYLNITPSLEIIKDLFFILPKYLFISDPNVYIHRNLKTGDKEDVYWRTRSKQGLSLSLYVWK